MPGVLEASLKHCPCYESMMLHPDSCFMKTRVADASHSEILLFLLWEQLGSSFCNGEVLGDREPMCAYVCKGHGKGKAS